MAIRIDHDGLFKEITKDNFPEFVEACFAISPKTIEYFRFLDKESHKKSLMIGDLLVEVKFSFKKKPVLFHIEFKAQREPGFIKKAFKYYCRFNEDYEDQVITIVVFSHNVGIKEDEDYQVQFLDHQVLDYRIIPIQLNQQYWRDYIDKPNPIHAAFMTHMYCPEEEKVELKLEIFKMLSKLNLSEIRYEKILIFVETYLVLTEAQQKVFNKRLKKEIPKKEVAKMIELMTSYEKNGVMKEKIRIARNMLKDNYSVSAISKLTLLPQEKIMKLQK